MMPIDLVLVRHGESEGNVANRLSRSGDHSAFSDEFRKRHSSQWRLTDRGIKQARAASKWIKKNLGRFDRYYVSEYIRAKETAYLLNLPAAKWYVEFYLRERDWGQLDVMSEEDRVKKFSEEMIRRLRDPFLWAPPGGETMVDVCLRVDRILNTLHRECSDKRVIIVCHGEVMWSFRIRLERLMRTQFMKLDISKNPFDHIHNCQILHYTRRDPKSRELAENMNWVRSICPTDLTLSRNEWQKITRPKMSNDELMREVEGVKRLISKSAD